MIILAGVLNFTVFVFFFVWSLFCYVNHVLIVHSSHATVSLRKREPVALFKLLSCCHVAVTLNPEIFARILFSRIALKDIFCDAKNSRLEHDLHISLSGREISAFCGDFIFSKLHICEVSRK